CFLKVGQPAHPVRPAKNQNRILFRADRMHRLFNNQKTEKASPNCPSKLTIISVKATLQETAPWSAPVRIPETMYWRR
ncbi:MAG: hypothetical protein ACI4HI_00545, partial [Lachnospiraceae bacterium]